MRKIIILLFISANCLGQLPKGTEIKMTDEITIDQGDTTKKVSLSILDALINKHIKDSLSVFSYNRLLSKPVLLQGEKGDKGDTGPQGPQGIQGNAGSNGTNTPVFTTLLNGSTAMGFATNTAVKVTPTATATITTTVPAAGYETTLIVLTSGTTSYTLTFGTGFKPVSTLATGTTSGKLFTIRWISDGTNLIETGRTAAH